MQTSSWFHEGEREAQARAGESDLAAQNGRVYGDTIMAGALPFLRRQTMLIAGADDASGRLWASMLFGEPGFLSSDDGRALRINLTSSAPRADDPLWGTIAADREIGLLSIELATRRRLRVNGRVSSHTDTQLMVDVAAAYANCPKYIQRRTLQVLPSSTGLDAWTPATAPTTGTQLEHADRALIANADTFFVASRHPERGADVSHRGGNPGFIELRDARTLRIPDYSGNGLFNTLGNFVSHPFAGLLFLDVDRGRSLHLTGTVEILWAHDEAGRTTGGTGRYWEFHLDAWRSQPLSHRVSWELLDYSPWNPE